MAWRIPPVMANVPNPAIEKPAGSRVPWAQAQLFNATRQALAAIAQDVAAGLAETVGLRCEWNPEMEADARCSIIVELPALLPEGREIEYLARAIDLENVEAWCDEKGRLHVGIGPWYSTKDVDQVVLSITKVTHVKLGLHATDRQRAQAQKAGS